MGFLLSWPSAVDSAHPYCGGIEKTLFILECDLKHRGLGCLLPLSFPDFESPVLGAGGPKRSPFGRYTRQGAGFAILIGIGLGRGSKPSLRKDSKPSFSNSRPLDCPGVCVCDRGEAISEPRNPYRDWLSASQVAHFWVSNNATRDFVFTSWSQAVKH